MVNDIIDDKPRKYYMKRRVKSYYDADVFRGTEIDFDVNAKSDLEVIYGEKPKTSNVQSSLKSGM